MDDHKHHRFIDYINDQLSPGNSTPPTRSRPARRPHSRARASSRRRGLRPVLPARTRIERTWCTLIREGRQGLSRIRTVSAFLAAEVAAGAAFFNEP